MNTKKEEEIWKPYYVEEGVDVTRDSGVKVFRGAVNVKRDRFEKRDGIPPRGGKKPALKPGKGNLAIIVHLTPKKGTNGVGDKKVEGNWATISR